MMKLTCVLIVAVLLLSTCELITSRYSREKKGDPVLRSTRKMGEAFK